MGKLLGPSLLRKSELFSFGKHLSLFIDGLRLFVDGIITYSTLTGSDGCSCKFTANVSVLGIVLKTCMHQTSKTCVLAKLVTLRTSQRMKLWGNHIIQWCGQCLDFCEFHVSNKKTTTWWHQITVTMTMQSQSGWLRCLPFLCQLLFMCHNSQSSGNKTTTNLMHRQKNVPSNLEFCTFSENISMKYQSINDWAQSVKKAIIFQLHKI